jgi:hypothetical protein
MLIALVIALAASQPEASGEKITADNGASR